MQKSIDSIQYFTKQTNSLKNTTSNPFNAVCSQVLYHLSSRFISIKHRFYVKYLNNNYIKYYKLFKICLTCIKCVTILKYVLHF